MCCGSNRLPKSFARARTVPGKVVPGRSAPEASIASAPAPATRAVATAPKFVYSGNTGLTVVSPITGRRYRFDRSGARLEVDPRDRSWLNFVPNLQAV
jgi:hypothetical protein